MLLHHVSVCRRNPCRNKPIDQQTISHEGDNDMSGVIANKFYPKIEQMKIAEIIICNKVSFRV